MGVEVHGEGPQARGQQRQDAGHLRQAGGLGQVEEHGPGGGRQGRGGLELWRAGLTQGGLESGQGLFRLGDAPQGQVGEGEDEGGGEPCPLVLAVEVGLRLQGGGLGVAAEVVVLRLGDVPLGAGLHGSGRGLGLPRVEGGCSSAA